VLLRQLKVPACHALHLIAQHAQVNVNKLGLFPQIFNVNGHDITIRPGQHTRRHILPLGRHEPIIHGQVLTECVADEYILARADQMDVHVPTPTGIIRIRFRKADSAMVCCKHIRAVDLEP